MMSSPPPERSAGAEGRAAGPTRRESLKLGLSGILAAGAAPLFVPARVLGGDAPSNRITLGFIGVGGQGLGYNLNTFLQQDDAQVVAVCDVFADRRAAARHAVEQKYADTDCREYADFRHLLARNDIDAMVISTPDHWHTPMSLMALEAGKDVMCEKPTLTIAEGRVLVDAVKKHGKVFQVGLEDRSVIYYHRLAELVRNGAIGELHTIRVGLPAGNVHPIEEPAPVPDGLDWDMWLGPAPFHPYTPSRTGMWEWREVRDYSGGMLTDWGSHLMDTAQVANFAERTGPVEVEGEGVIPENAMNTVPAEFKLRYRYANGVVMHVESGGAAIRFEGTDGWVGNEGWRGRLRASDERILHLRFPEDQNKLWPMPPGEHRDFLNCIKSRAETTYPAEDGHRLSTAMHIGSIAMELGRKLHWDPDAEEFVDDEAANDLRSRPTRDDWKRA